VSHAAAWRCRSEACRTLLGRVQGGRLYPHVSVESVDGRGVARVPCPKCRRVKAWFPSRPTVPALDSEQATSHRSG
jgi:hypothetical protein